ncbi:uncharacterized protein TNCV_2629401 [Trichonephila clavipes]|uniref:Transposase n=1 Tax=Trichonephila clavipes TaxID=2585209 RepID=A0A8X6SDK1_TRICX|nr:uncharacterized protein TNCV_2629401 [Trichonephila clavipes]
MIDECTRQHSISLTHSCELSNEDTKINWLIVYTFTSTHRGSPVVKVSDHGRHVMSSSPVPLKTRRVGQRCMLNLSRAETSSLLCDVEVRRGGGCQLRCHPRHLTMVQNYVVRRSKPSCSSTVRRCQVIYSQFGLAIHQNDHQARRRFVEWDQNQIVVVPDFHKRILFSDEAHIWVNGYVNKQNCRIWSEANPQVYIETPLHPEKLTVWCALWAGGILLQKR